MRFRNLLSLKPQNAAVSTHCNHESLTSSWVSNTGRQQEGQTAECVCSLQDRRSNILPIPHNRQWQVDHYPVRSQQEWKSHSYSCSICFCSTWWVTIWARVRNEEGKITTGSVGALNLTKNVVISSIIVSNHRVREKNTVLHYSSCLSNYAYPTNPDQNPIKITQILIIMETNMPLKGLEKNQTLSKGWEMTSSEMKVNLFSVPNVWSSHII